MQKVPVHISEQSPDIAGGVHVGKDDMDVGASDETSGYMPLNSLHGHHLGKTLTEARKSGNAGGCAQMARLR